MYNVVYKYKAMCASINKALFLFDYFHSIERKKQSLKNLASAFLISIERQK